MNPDQHIIEPWAREAVKIRRYDDYVEVDVVASCKLHKVKQLAQVLLDVADELERSTNNADQL